LNKTKEVKREHPSYSSKPQPAPEPQDQHDTAPATRQNVEDVFEQFAQLIHASRRPLPSQTGDGSYLEKEEPTGFWADLKNLSLKDVKTVEHIMEDKASGKPQNDRDMHMEEVMQVREISVLD
jgi:linoleate 10R-lipoxygenase